MMRRIDLLPVAYVQRRKERRNISFVILAGLLIVLLLMVWYFMLRGQISSARTELAGIQTRNQVLEGQIAELQRFAALDAEVKAKRTALQTVFAGDIDWPSVMTSIAMVTPGEVWLDGVEATGSGVDETLLVSEIPLTQKATVGSLSFNANSASCMPGVAKWLVRMANVDEFDAAWIGSAAEADSRPGCEPPVVFDSTLELNEKALSHRFEGEIE
jgi:Tfp pilus assembly protein PilN